jgi:hypothetical protein
MSTQPNPKIEALVDGMLSAGVPRYEAEAIASAVEFALDSANYTKIYGVKAVDSLNNFLDRLS